MPNPPSREVRRLLRDVLNQYADVSSTYELSVHAIEQMDDKQRVDALMYLLPRVIRQISARDAGAKAAGSEDTAAAWGAVTHEIVRVGGTDHFLRDCDSTQVTTLATIRDNTGNALKARAKKLHTLAETMREGGWATVGDVPSDIGTSIMIDAAEIRRMKRDIAGMPQIRRLLETLQEMDASNDSPALREAHDRHGNVEQNIKKQRREIDRLKDIGKRLVKGLDRQRWNMNWSKLEEHLNEG